MELYKVRTVLALLNRLELRPTWALIIRDGELLTPDRQLKHGDVVEVRKVMSVG